MRDFLEGTILIVALFVVPGILGGCERGTIPLQTGFVACVGIIGASMVVQGILTLFGKG